MITGASSLGRRLHDRETLLHVVDVEGRHAVAVVGGMVEQLAQGDAGHRRVPPVMACRARAIARRAASATLCGVMPNSR